MSKDTLSQSEIDVLLGEANPDKVAQHDDPSIPRLFDFTAYDKIVRGRMPTLEIVGERFVRGLRVSLFNFLRRSAEINLQGVIVTKFGEYAKKLFLPTSLNIIKIRPLRGSGLLILDAKFVYVLVDNFFGGEGKFQNKIEGREFTPTENRIIQIIINMAFKDFEEAWRPIMPVEFVFQSSEVNPAMANIVAASEIVVICKFSIELEGGIGEMHLVLPYSMLEPIKNLLDSVVQSDVDTVDEKWINILHDDVYGAKLSIKGIVAKKKMSLKEVKSLKPGDIIPIELPEHTIMLADGVAAYKAKLGRKDDKYALKIIEPVAEKFLAQERK